MKAEELKTALEGLPLRGVNVVVESERGRFVAVVSSPDFSGMSEFKRQNLVWERLHASFPIEQLPAVEFVFTLAPSEQQGRGVAR